MSEFTKRLKDICFSEWLHFGKQTYNINNSKIRRGKRETDEGFWQKIGVYWQVGINYDYDGLDTDIPWSAAFISYVMRLAGAKENFKYSIRHSDYINDSILYKNQYFKGHKISTYSPKVGDLVCYSRQNGVSFNNLPNKYKSHSDVVVKVNQKYIEVIGGNVGNSVSKKHLRINERGIIIDNYYDWFAVIETKI